MRKYVEEFKGFINKGDVVTIAVGLVMALYFQKIVEAVLDGVILPIISAIFGEANFADIGFDIGDARISIGLVLDAIISFVAVAFFLFLAVRLYNQFREENPAQPPADVQLLAEIRDELRVQRTGGAGGPLPPPTT